MKPWLSHLIYCGLLVGVGFYFGISITRANQRIKFENTSMHTAYEVLTKTNNNTRFNIGLASRMYPTPANQNIWLRTVDVDSLIALSMADKLVWSNLLPQLEVLIEQEQEVKSLLNELKPPQHPYATYPLIWKQMDSLRLQLARSYALDYLGLRIGADDFPEDRPFYSIQPAVSFTTLFPKAGEPFRMDVVLQCGNIFLRSLRFLVNKQPLSLNDGIGSFTWDFHKPGNYSLISEITVEDVRRDTLLTVQKTFYLGIKH